MGIPFLVKVFFLPKFVSRAEFFIIILQIQVINCSSAFKFKTVMVNNSTNTNINEQIPLTLNVHNNQIIKYNKDYLSRYNVYKNTAT
jgi:hypothetical protein